MRQHTPSALLPGDPIAVWDQACTGPVADLVRPRGMPQPESVDEVAKWEDPDGFGKIELYYAPALWVLLPLGALGCLLWGTVVNPQGHRWVGAVFGETVEGAPWSFWIVWAAVGIWLVIAIGVLSVGLSLAKDVRAQNQWIFEHCVPHTVHRSPFIRDGGEGFLAPTFIAIDHRTGDAQTARVYHALRDWLSDESVQQQLTCGKLRGPQGLIPAHEIFGDDAAGGYYIESIPGYGSAGDFAAHQWVLITVPRDGGREITVTTVPLKKKLQKIRRKLHRRAARKSPS